MSPAGIPMFYGALDERTVRAELYDPLRKGQIVTLGTFVTAREFAIVDLTLLPNIPSLFDEQNRHKRPGLKFLYDFVRDLSKPIKKDGCEHIEYVPTQVVTEYFRRIFKTNSGATIRGIIYQSSKKGMGKCCVLFFENEDCCNITKDWNQLKEEESKWLGLDTGSIKRVTTFKCAQRDPIDLKNLS